MIRTLIFAHLFFYGASLGAMEHALCTIPTVMDLLCSGQPLSSNALAVVGTSSITDISYVAAESFLTSFNVIFSIGAFGATIFLLQDCFTNPTQVLEARAARNNELMAQYLLYRGGNPFTCIDIEDDNLTNDATERDDNPHDVERSLTRCAAIHRAAHNVNLKLLKLYISHKKDGDDIDIQNDLGETALFLVCSSEKANTARCIRLLLEHSACIQSTNYRGLSPLHCAAYNENDQAVSELIAQGAQLNAQDFKGNTPFHYAAKVACREVVKQLLQAGARPDIANADGLIPLDVAHLHMMAAPRIVWNKQHQRATALEDNPHLKKLSHYGHNVFTKLFNRELGLK